MYPLNHSRREHCSRAKRGLSLLEVVLALAILGVSAAFLTQAMQFATQNALKAQNLSQAELVAESVVGQIVAGVLPAQPVTWSPYGVSLSSTSWLYAITIVPAEVQGMMGIQVAVRDSSRISTNEQPDLLLTRWIIDPSLGLDVPPEPESTDQSTASSSSGSTGSQASSSGGQAGGAQTGSASQTGATAGGGFGGFQGGGGRGQQGRGQGRGGQGAERGGQGSGPGGRGQQGQGGGGPRGAGGGGPSGAGGPGARGGTGGQGQRPAAGQGGRGSGGGRGN